MSSYRLRWFRPSDVVVHTAVLSAAIPMRAWYVLAGLSASIVIRLLFRRYDEDRLRIDEQGLHFPNFDLAWSDLAGIESARPPVTWSDRLVLTRPLVYPRWLSFQKFRTVSLARYERNWHSGRIGQDMARWAPHLLEGRERAHA